MIVSESPKIELFNSHCYDVLLGMGDNSVDFFLQDTPFGVTQNEWDKVPDFKKLWPEWLRVGKENTCYLFFATQPFACDLINSNRGMFRYDLIWYKSLASGFLNAKKMPLRNHESIIIFYKKLPKYNPQMGVGIRKKGKVKNERLNSNYNKFGGEKEFHIYDDKGTRYPQSVVDFSNGDRQNESDHPTQKPVDLFRYLINTFTNEGDTVFDGYGGSLTTAKASYFENRNAIVCENKKEYFDDGLKSFKEYSLQQSLFK